MDTRMDFQPYNKNVLASAVEMSGTICQAELS